jgi:NYN domain
MIVFLIDADNLSAPPWIDEAMHKLEAAEGAVAVRRAYGSAENLKGLADVLRVWAIRPFVNLSLSKNTTDIALAVDATEFACQTPQPKVIVIGSGDADFVPLVVRLRERGIRVICVSERSKMAQEAARAYDDVWTIGGEQVVGEARQALNNVPVKKTTPRKIAAKKTPAKTAPAKKAAAKKTVEQKTDNSTNAITVQQILHAAPSLRTGQPQRLGDIAKALHDAKLLGRNATSTKLFKKFPQHFEMSPAKQPNQVCYLP